MQSLVIVRLRKALIATTEGLQGSLFVVQWDYKKVFYAHLFFCLEQQDHMLFCKYTRQQYRDVTDFMNKHLAVSKGSYVAVDEILRMFVHVTGEVHVTFKCFIAILQKAKGGFVYVNGHDSVYIDHTLSLAPILPPPVVMDPADDPVETTSVETVVSAPT